LGCSEKAYETASFSSSSNLKSCTSAELKNNPFALLETVIKQPSKTLKDRQNLNAFQGRIDAQEACRLADHLDYLLEIRIHMIPSNSSLFLLSKFTM